MLIMASIIHFGKSGLPTKPMTDDDVDRIATCLRVLAEKSPLMNEIFNDSCRESLSLMLASKVEEEKELQRVSERKIVKVQADDPIAFNQLINKGELGATENMFELTLSQALGMSSKKDADPMGASKLNKVTQLTGFSDPVYAEAYVNVNQFDIVLDVLIVNQTSDTLQNLTLELATLGDLKLVEKPSPLMLAPHDFCNIKANVKVTCNIKANVVVDETMKLVEKPSPLMLAPHDFCNIKANVKVASTENGIIFGNIVYDVSGAASDRNCVVLNDIHIDIMDYIVPASCNDGEFRQMWAEFEWENKVAVNTNISDLQIFLQHVIKCTNMKCLTPDKALSGECGFMAANLYAKSIFGEDVLANLSIEKPVHLPPTAPVQGHIRIRAKSQGMALSMGDKINLSQKSGAKMTAVAK
ncbi:COPB1 [Mytilus coruscus]|uniref:COPB1 n=1 Tax=Mytilus coruscus TaxID=42192 RepID=A0A6J8DBD3_MYTCO|nr:unnamed protein product [Mytilus coruscus]CAC5404661.1 unnamed protein product [Mytilus coruscus]CAC5404662.1 COPB1 [Mytilus coruscus]